MKTQKKPFLMLVFFFMVSCMSQVSATVIDTIYVTANMSTETHNICSNANDSVMMHCPIGHTNIRWMDPFSQTIDGPDSVFVTSSNQGHWRFYSDELGAWKHIYIYLVSAPYEPASMANDTSVCTTSLLLELNAENPASSYFWSTGTTTQWYDVTTPGTYAVTVTNTCGIGVYSKTISYNNPNAPHLGPDQVFCWGSTSVLDPGSTNVATYQWSNGSNSPMLTIDTTGTYWVYVVDNAGCSGRDTVQITTLVPIGEEICYVEFDTLTCKNNINWTSNLPGNSDSVRIYKEISLGVWDLLGTMSNLDTNFIDIGSNPQAQSYSYNISIVDTCGNESAMSQHHTTITLLSAYDVGTNTYGFTWSAYQGLTVTDYYLFGIDAGNNVTQIATVPGNIYMYNYVNPSTSYVKYFVGFETPDCYGSKANVIVKSNWVQSVVSGIENPTLFEFSVFPNPVNEQFEIRTSLKNYEIEITNVFGQVLLKEKHEKVVKVNNFAPGTYILKVSGDNLTRQERIIVY